ncbi:MAG TPA: hypothetical protein VJ183_06335 [Chloroflexia bacterium]|nr:hypothetical protein [Chloroflexia bacterium]
MEGVKKRSIQGAYFVALALMLANLALGWRVGAQAVAAQGNPEIGFVEVIALDGAGNGWAWAGPPPQIFEKNFLLRIENGSWRIATDSEKSGSVLPGGATIHSIALTENGDEGWAVGAVCCDASPLTLRLQKGVWSQYKSLPLNFSPRDLAITPDGTDGWMAGVDEISFTYKMMRLRNGKWEAAPALASGGGIRLLALSPDGKKGWAVGPRSSSDVTDIDAPHAAYRLNNGRWDVVQGGLYKSTHDPFEIAADNLGSGWIVAANTTENQPVDGELWRLSEKAAPRRITLQTPRPDVALDLMSVDVDGSGRGWVVGSLLLGQQEDPPVVESLYQPLLYRVQGDSATLVPKEVAGYVEGANLRPISVEITRNGAHSWAGSHNGIGFGHLSEIREPWAHANPPAAKPLQGAGKCFAEVPHCLRGVFATYWSQKGGLDLFGYPITPEVQETLDGKTYTVQYTQRARFEYHPENKAPFDVLLGLLGNTLSEPRQNEEPFKPKPPGIVPSEEWFEQTQHNVRPPFLDYWKKNGGLPVFGLPKSESFEEKNAADGKIYLVQYFERNRLEYHPELKGTKFEMLLGLLGTEQFKGTYGYAP